MPTLIVWVPYPLTVVELLSYVKVSWVVTFSIRKNLDLDLQETFSLRSFLLFPFPLLFLLSLFPSLNPLLLIKWFIFIYVYMCVPAHLCVHHVCAGTLETTRRCRILWSEVTGLYELPDSVLGTEPWFSAKASSVLNWWATPPPRSFLLFFNIWSWIIKITVLSLTVISYKI